MAEQRLQIVQIYFEKLILNFILKILYSDEAYFRLQ